MNRNTKFDLRSVIVTLAALINFGGVYESIC